MEGVFRNETQVLMATEAAGEGINLQFCYLMVNYDIPWNPNWLEQRNNCRPSETTRPRSRRAPPSRLWN